MQKIIAVNAGSSSLKFQLIEMPSEKVLLSGLMERIGLENGECTLKFNGIKKSFTQPIPNHQVAVKLLLEALLTEKIVSDYKEISAIGHRIVHGGELYKDSVLLDQEVEKNLVAISDLAPLHNPANLLGYRSFKEVLPHVAHVAVFDTSFHQTMEKTTFLYPIPYQYYNDFKIRRYGFHGTSHRYVSAQAIEMLGNPKESKIITCHLGNGASLAAVKNGKSINTSMGFTPLAGVMMGTRSGDIDPAIITYLMQKLNVSATEVVNTLNKKSGLLGISELSSDARDIENAILNGNAKARLAKDMYVNSIAERIGSYFINLGGLDAIVFTAGLGENDQGLREELLKIIAEPLGIKYDLELNKQRGKAFVISTPESKVKVLVIPTNEELMIVRDTVRIMGKSKHV